MLDLICAEHTNTEIAAELFLSVKTVDHNVSAVLAKLGVPTRAAARRVAQSALHARKFVPRGGQAINPARSTMYQDRDYADMNQNLMKYSGSRGVRLMLSHSRRAFPLDREYCAEVE